MFYASPKSCRTRIKLVRILPLAAVALTLSFGERPVDPAQNGPNAELRISGDVARPLTLSASDLKGMPRQILKVSVPNENKEKIYEGVAVRELLHRAIVPQDEKLRFRPMTIYVRAEAEENHMAFSFVDFDPDVQDSEVIVADMLNGLPLGEKQGPFELVEPHYKGHVRVVRMLKCLRVLSAAPAGKS